MTGRRRSEFIDQHEKHVDLHPAASVRSYEQAVRELRELEAGAVEPRHDGDTIEHRLRKARKWRDSFRAVGACKKCGEKLTGSSVEARLARARGIGPTCWTTRCTEDERVEITAWLEAHVELLDREPV